MVVLVSGCAGFIGFHAARALLERGHRVVGIDSLSESYYPAVLKQDRLSQLNEHRDFLFLKADLSEGVPEGPGPVDAVAHLAADASVLPSFENAAQYIRNNVLATQRLFDWAARQRGLQHVIYASSSSVYGHGAKGRPWREDDPLLPISPYGATKLANEAQAQTLFASAGVPVTGLRFFKVYGPWGRPDTVFYKFIDRVCRGAAVDVHNYGDISHSFTYVDDAVGGLVSALERPPQTDAVRHPVYNVAGDWPVSLDEALEVIERCTGRTATRRPRPLPAGDRSYSHADVSRAKADLGFTNRTTLAEGLRALVNWYLAYHDPQTDRRKARRSSA